MKVSSPAKKTVPNAAVPDLHVMFVPMFTLKGFIVPDNSIFALEPLISVMFIIFE